MPRTSSPPILEFHRRDPIRDGLRRIVASLTEATRSQADRPPSEQASAVHEMRRLLKRQRALVRLLRPSIGDAAADRENRGLGLAARHLAAARDATVGLRTLDVLASQAPRKEAAAVVSVRERFAGRVHDRQTRAPAVAKALQRAANAAAGSAVRLDRLPWERGGWDVLAAGLRAGYRRARNRARKARLSADETVFHAWRTATKSLMYQVALLRPARPARLRRLIAGLDDLQDRLGLEHDLAVLAGRIAAGRRTFGDAATVNAVLALIANRQQGLRKDCLRRGKKLFTARPAEFVAALHLDWKRWRRD